MQPINVTLGLKVIPARFVPAFMDVGEDLRRALSDAGTLVSRAPSPWEIVEEPSHGELQLNALRFKTVPIKLSDEEQRRGRRHSGQAQPQGPARHRRTHLQPAKPRRAVLLKAQTKPQTGDPIRQDRRQLPRIRPRRIHPTVDQTLCPHRLV